MLKRGFIRSFGGIHWSVLPLLLALGLFSTPSQATTLTYHFSTQQLINAINIAAPPTASQAVFFEFFLQPVLNATLTNYNIISATSPIPAGIDMYQVSVNANTPTGCMAATPACAAGTNFARYFINTSNTKVAYVTSNANVAGKGYTINDVDPAINGQIAEVMPLIGDFGMTIFTSNSIASTQALTFAWTLLGHGVNVNGTLDTGSKSFEMSFNMTQAEVPEPNTVGLFGVGLLSVFGLWFRRSSKRTN